MAAAALVAAVVAGIRRVHTVAIGQVVMFIAICAIMPSAKAAGERFYESSYWNACHAGAICDTPRSLGKPFTAPDVTAYQGGQGSRAVAQGSTAEDTWW
ncbi:hypothetical protein ACFC1R_08930 [Kitasatospora sp. NPDC056138]|uniref:hypothetical protein n=1 Tax=Kitasatospora sp. NPDC056138 TaxID=3345724 RepID=UPI0035D701F3